MSVQLDTLVLRVLLALLDALEQLAAQVNLVIRVLLVRLDELDLLE